MSLSGILDANSCIMRTYTECVCKLFIINTYGTKDLKFSRMNTYKKMGGVGVEREAPDKGRSRGKKVGVIIVTFPGMLQGSNPECLQPWKRHLRAGLHRLEKCV